MLHIKCSRAHLFPIQLGILHITYTSLERVVTLWKWSTHPSLDNKKKKDRQKRQCTVVATCRGIGVSIWEFASCDCGEILFTQWWLLNRLKMAAKAPPTVPESKETAQWRRRAMRGCVGTGGYHCPMTLLTNESSSSSFLIPTKWSTTSPPRMAITMGTAETWGQTEPRVRILWLHNMWYLIINCAATSKFRRNESGASYRSHPIFNSQICVVIDVNFCHGDATFLFCNRFLQPRPKDLTGAAPPEKREKKQKPTLTTVHSLSSTHNAKLYSSTEYLYMTNKAIEQEKHRGRHEHNLMELSQCFQ